MGDRLRGHDGVLTLVVLGLVAAAIVGLPAKTRAAETRAPEAELAIKAVSPDIAAAARKYFPANDAAIAKARIFRLTRDQLDATAAALFPGLPIPSAKDKIARDPQQTNYDYAELIGINGANGTQVSGWISAIAAQVKKSPLVIVDCKASNTSETCLAAAARAFVIKATRGDVAEDRIAKFIQFFLAGVKSSSLPQATSDLVEVVLNSPDFLFRKETITSARSNRLAPAQLLEAVTYTLTDAPPDSVGLASAKANDYLRTSQDAAGTISGLVQSPLARAKLARFFRAWLEVKETGDFTISPKVYPEFDEKLETAMLAETDRFLGIELAQGFPKLKAITQAHDAFVSKALEPLYGIKAADAEGVQPVPTNGTQRLGIFSQPAVIASHSGPASTRPIKRGVFFARKVLCLPMEPPPKDLHAKLYDLVGATERQRVEQSTSGAACIGCHKILNPLGFFQEPYDATGRWRTADAGQPIDASALLDFLGEGPKQTKTPVEALTAITSSLQFKQCFVRQVFRFYMGRNEEPADDALLRRMFMTFAANDEQDLLSLVYTLVSSDRIVRRE